MYSNARSCYCIHAIVIDLSLTYYNIINILFLYFPQVTMESSVCKICEDIVSGPKEERITLTQRGIPNMRQAALRRNDSTVFNIGGLFHKRCKHEYTNLKTLKSLERQQSSSSEKTTTKRKLRSRDTYF